MSAGWYRLNSKERRVSFLTTGTGDPDKMSGEQVDQWLNIHLPYAYDAFERDKKYKLTEVDKYVMVYTAGKYHHHNGIYFLELIEDFMMLKLKFS